MLLFCPNVYKGWFHATAAAVTVLAFIEIRDNPSAVPVFLATRSSECTSRDDISQVSHFGPHL